MKACPGCGTFVPDESRFCPSCGGGQDAGAAAPAPPPGGVPAAGEPAPPGPTFDRAAAEGRVRVLGVLYMVMGGLVLASVGVSVLQFAMGDPGGDLELELERTPDPQVRDFLQRLSGILRSTALVAVLHLVPLSLGALYAWSGWRLWKFRGSTPALVAAVCMVVVSPCSGCCCLSIPLGVYALFLLTRADTETVLRG